VLRVAHSWGDERVWFYNETERLMSLPEAWTSLAPADPFVVLSEGRAFTRTDDLLRLVQLVRELSGGSVKEKR
jgi:hypothetical protein